MGVLFDYTQAEEATDEMSRLVCAILKKDRKSF